MATINNQTTAIVRVDESDYNGRWTHNDIVFFQNKFAKDTTQEEFKHFLDVAARYDLDPRVGHIYCQKYRNRSGGFHPAQVIIGFHGLLHVANRQNMLDGIDSECVYDAKNKLIGAKATVWKRGAAHSFNAEVDLEEYEEQGGLWGKKPKTMIKKVAMAHALRLAFNLAGLYIPEEMGGNSSDDERVVDGEIVKIPAKLPATVTAQPTTRAVVPTALVPEPEPDDRGAGAPEPDDVPETKPKPERKYPVLTSDEFKKWVEREFRLTMAQLAGKLSAGKTQTIKEVIAPGSGHALRQKEMFPGDPMRYVLWAYVDHIARNEPQNVAFLWDKEAGLPLAPEDVPFGEGDIPGAAESVDAEAETIEV